MIKSQAGKYEQFPPVTVLDGLDDREQAIVAEARFFEPYKHELEQLYEALGEPWNDDPRELVGPALDNWLRGEHGNSARKKQYTPEQQADAWPVLAGPMRLLSPVRAPKGIVPHTSVVLGGVNATNKRRLAALPAKPGRVVLEAGQRLREVRDGSRGQLGQMLGRLAAQGVADPMVGKEMDKPFAIGDPWQRALATEAHIGRVNVLEQFPGATPFRYSLGEVTVPYGSRKIDLTQPKLRYTDEAGAVQEVPPRLVTDYHYWTPDGTEVVVMNAAAVPRSGTPRHTTTSCTREFLERLAPPSGADVLLVSSAPHLRTAYDMRTALDVAGRRDLRLHVALAPAAPDMPIQMPLGEIAALLDNDIKRNY